jgi:hypothetical protein
MKIKHAEAIHIAVPYRYGGASETDPRWRTMDTCLIRVETDDGIVGWGEGFGLGTWRDHQGGVRQPGPPADPSRPATLTAYGRPAAQAYNSARNGPVAYAPSASTSRQGHRRKVAGQRSIACLRRAPAEARAGLCQPFALRQGRSGGAQRGARAGQRYARASSCTRSPSPKWRRRAAYRPESR